jgi:hypothetical protein
VKGLPGKIDSLALNILRLIFLIQGLIFGGLARITKNTDWADQFEQRSYSGWMLFDNPNMLPEEMLTPLMWMVKFAIVIFPVAFIWFNIIKPLVFGD